MPSDAFRRYLRRTVAALAIAVPFVRPGTALPGAAAPLLGAPSSSTRSKTRRSDRRALRSSLAYAVREGMAAEVFTAFAGATVLTGWALALRLSPFLVGALSALPFLAQGVQFPAAWLTSRFGHRRVALTAVSLSRVSMLPLCVLPWLPLTLAGQQRLLLGVALVSAVLGVLGNNAWVTWMGELVPESFRGRYFGRRTALCTLGGTLSSLLAGTLLDSHRVSSGINLALPLLALLACLAGVVASFLMARQHDPAPQGSVPKLELRAVLQPLRDGAARRVLCYQVLWNAAVGVSAPYFALHMLQNLKMSFVVMAVHAAAVATVRILTAPLWGRVIDRVGAQPVLLACSLGIAFIPALWLLPTEGELWPLLFDVMLAGSLWSGHALAAFELPLSVAPRKGRPFYLAAFASAGGLAYAGASAVGGGLAMTLPANFTWGGHAWVNLHVLFVLSGAARLAAAFFAARIVAPNSEPARNLGRLVSLLSRGLREQPAPVLARGKATLASELPRSRASG